MLHTVKSPSLPLLESFLSLAAMVSPGQPKCCLVCCSSDCYQTVHQTVNYGSSIEPETYFLSSSTKTFKIEITSGLKKGNLTYKAGALSLKHNHKFFSADAGFKGGFQGNISISTAIEYIFKLLCKSLIA